LVAELQVTLYM